MDTNQIAPRKKMTATPATQPAKVGPHQTLLRLGKDGNKFFSSPNHEPYGCLNFEQSSKAAPTSDVPSETHSLPASTLLTLFFPSLGEPLPFTKTSSFRGM